MSVLDEANRLAGWIARRQQLADAAHRRPLESDRGRGGRPVPRATELLRGAADRPHTCRRSPVRALLTEHTKEPPMNHKKKLLATTAAVAVAAMPNAWISSADAQLIDEALS